MTVPNSNTNEEEFVEARNSWELEKLYIDLGSAKRKSLTPVEKKFLRGLLCGFSPAEIASTVYQSRSSSTVRVYLSNGLYKYIEEMLSQQTGYSVKVKNWSRVTQLLEKAGYKKAVIHNSFSKIIKTNRTQETVDNRESAIIEDWGEAIDVSIFHGRTTELSQVQNWILQEHCRLVVLMGMGGIGKTAFSVKLAEFIKDDFEYVVWRSLRLAPHPNIIFNDILQILLPNQEENNNIKTGKSGLIQILDCLRSSRCLIILDNFDSILESEVVDRSDRYFTVNSSHQKNSPFFLTPIRYREGYESYGEFIRLVGDSQHQSCVIVTTREKPQEITAIQGKNFPVRSLKLTGLTYTDSQAILQAKGLTDVKDEECKSLIESYAGNPLFIKIIATAIQELFDGSLPNFLEQGTIVFGEIREILDQQFNRLSSLEKLIMYWLALNQEDLSSVRKLQKDIIPRVSQRLILEAIDLLQRRSLIEKQSSKFSQVPVLMEYIAEKLIEENFKLMEENGGSLLTSYTILERQIKNYFREMRLSAEI